MRSENSGLIDLDALLKEASSGELPPSPDDSLEAVAAPSPPPPLSPPPPPPAPGPPAPASSSAPAQARAPAPTSVRPAPVRRRSFAPWVALAFAIFGVAFVVGRRPSPSSPSPVLPAAAAPSPSPSTRATAAAPERAGDVGIELGALPGASEAPSANAIASANVTSARTSVVTPDAQLSAKIVALADAPPSSSSDLGGAMRDAVGTRAPASTAAPNDDGPGGSARQLKPSPGAVIGAINSVLPAARACLEDGDPPRNATIVFRSDGTVARVDLAGGERPKDECIKSALARARTMPFVDDTFAARATVRP